MRRISRFNMALMLALAGTTAVSLALPVDGAFAQRTEKKGKKGKEEAPQLELSPEFRNSFAAAQTAFGANDLVTAETSLTQAAAIAASADEKYLTGKMMLQIGLKKQDEAMQMKGVETALASGKSTEGEVRTFNSFIGEKALVKNDFARADGDPPASARIQRNLANQFEAPVFVWIAALLLILAERVTLWDIAAAWVFLAGRLIHTAVQCSGDNVALRGQVFTINFLGVLWLMGHAILAVACGF